MVNVSNKAKKIKVVLTDVDGVLTDGGMYYSAKGDIMKRFFVRDGMGVTLLRKMKIPTIIVTKEKNPIITQWAKRMKVKKVYDGVLNKELILQEICDTFDVTAEQVAYIGDDINDLGLLRLVGLSATPNDGISDAKKVSDYVCKSHSGHGAFREIADIIISSTKVKS
ncbi:KdsC family phosphatase [Candidatus Nitrosotenuis cloacae]|uniref:KdsC family phosphatase n=1 Tax=Candidatus Nitrosotenuis cloacae TaxID=1603555 RepID=UPI0022804F51|nr:HAD hydrolase family protein [Candidatus Nitrosotenuis cloacae]